MGHSTTAFAPTVAEVSDGAGIEGEQFESIARLVVAPHAGVFEPALGLHAGSTISAGQVVGHLTGGREPTPVISPFTGQSGEALAWAGERLVSYQPIMWLSVSEPPS